MKKFLHNFRTLRSFLSPIEFLGLLMISVAASLFEVASVLVLDMWANEGSGNSDAAVFLPEIAMEKLNPLVIFMLVALIGVVLRFLVLFATGRISYVLEQRMTNMALEAISGWSLEQLADVSPNELTATVLNDVNFVVKNQLLPSISLLVSMVPIGGLTAVLIFISDTEILILAIFVLIFFYSLKIWLPGFLTIQGREREASNRGRFQGIQEFLQGFSEIKCFNAIDYFTASFKRYTEAYQRSQTNVYFITIIPKFFIEFLLFGGGLLFIFFSDSDFFRAEVIVVYGFLISRMLPVVNIAYSSWTGLQYSRETSSKIDHLMLSRVNADSKSYLNSKIQKDGKAGMILRNLTCKIKDKKTGKIIELFQNLTFNFEAKGVYHISGPSGIGKTTLLEIMAGLRSPSSGQVILPANQEVAYLSQFPFVVEGGERENFHAFGVDSSTDQFQYLARALCIENCLDRGGRSLSMSSLSGGQKQRIGLLRVLGSARQICLLDEFDSGLHESLALAVLDVIRELSGTRLFIITSHRRPINNDASHNGSDGLVITKLC